VLRLALEETTGAWTFTLINPIDNSSGTAAIFDLSALVQAVDFDGDALPLSGDFKVTVTDDAPVTVSATALGGTVNEGGLANGNETAAASPTVFTGASGSLDTLVHFGADGKNATPFGFVSSASDALAALGIHSHGVLVDTAQVSGTTLTASAGGTNVFTLALNSDDSWTVT